MAGSAAGVSTLGVVVDIPSEGGFVTLVALADGTTSMYTSTGGGVVGAGAQEAVASANAELLRIIDSHSQLFPADDRTDLPGPELVQVTLLTRAARQRASIDLSMFWGQEPSTIPDLIEAIQNLITALRESTPT
jgi:hypothetical protein